MPTTKKAEDPVEATSKRVAWVRAVRPTQLFGWQYGKMAPDLSKLGDVLDAGSHWQSVGLSSDSPDVDGAVKTFLILRAGTDMWFARPEDFEVADTKRKV